MLAKARKLISFDKLELPLKRQLLKAYPDGFEDSVMRIDAPTPFYAVLFEADDITYLVKLNNYLVNASSEDLEDEFEDDSEMSDFENDETDDDE
ncbi:MAG: hypothetical protein NXI10_06205 [bacterium]|nr:hypothetical protein [bacterium]